MRDLGRELQTRIGATQVALEAQNVAPLDGTRQIIRRNRGIRQGATAGIATLSIGALAAVGMITWGALRDVAPATPTPSPSVTLSPSPSVTPALSPFPPPAATLEEFKLVTIVFDEYGHLPLPNEPDSIVAWAEDYCEAANLSPCTGIPERAVFLCIERWDCHPAVMVPFDQGTAAFLMGGIFADPQVIAVWRPESDPEVAPYGGARKLLENYLRLVQVYPPGDRA